MLNGVQFRQVQWILDAALSVTWCPDEEESNTALALIAENYPYEGRELSTLEQQVVNTALGIMTIRLESGTLEKDLIELRAEVNHPAGWASV